MYTGFYVNGKSSIPTTELARRVYCPDKKSPTKTVDDMIKTSMMSLCSRRTSKSESASKYQPPHSRPQTSSGDSRRPGGGGLVLDGLGGVEEGVSEFQMFLESRAKNQERARTAPEQAGRRGLSQGKKHHQVIQSVDVLFP